MLNSDSSSQIISVPSLVPLRRHSAALLNTQEIQALQEKLHHGEQSSNENSSEDPNLSHRPSVNYQRMNQRSHTHARLQIFKALKTGDVETEHEEHHTYTRKTKDEYFKTRTTQINQSLVTKERLTQNIALDDEEDRKLVVNILLKQPNSRSKEEVLFTEAALKTIKFFTQVEHELDAPSFTNLFKSIFLERYNCGQTIFNHGEIGRKFYIIIKGSVYILLKNEGLITPDSNSYRGTQEEPLDRAEKLQKVLNSSISEEEKRKKVEIFYPGFWIVKTAHQGESFGEIGLQKGGNRPRSATVVAREDCLLGVWSYEDYSVTFAKIYETKYKEKIGFFEKINAFSHWTQNQISSFVVHVEEMKCPRNKVILKEGETPNYMYFIKSGEIEVRKNVPVQDDRKELIYSIDDKEKHSRYKTRKYEFIPLGKLVQGEYFGLPVSLEKSPNHFTATVTSSEASLVTIPIFVKAKFLKFIRDQTTLDKLREHFARRDEWHRLMINNYLNLSKNKVFTEPPMSPKEQPLSLSLTKVQNSHLNNSIQTGKTPKIPLKPMPHLHPQTRDVSAEGSRRLLRSGARTPSYGGVEIAQADINSHRFFQVESGPKLKFGFAYEKHQHKLKKLFGGDKGIRGERSEKALVIKKNKPNLRLTTTATSLRDHQIEPAYELDQALHIVLSARLGSPTSGTYDKHSGKHYSTEDSISALPSTTLGIKAWSSPFRSDTLTPTEIHKLSSHTSARGSPPLTTEATSSTPKTVHFGGFDNHRLPTEGSIFSVSQNFKNEQLKRVTFLRKESGIKTPSSPKTMNSFPKKS